MKKVSFRIMLPTLIGVVGLCSLWGVPQTAGVAAREGELAGPKQIVKTEELMKLLFDPSYLQLKESIQQKPAKREDWRAIYAAAYRLSEVTNLLLFREGKDYMQTEQWEQLSLQSRNAAVAVGDAVKKLNYEAIRQEYSKLIDTCNQCHRKFEPEDPTEVEP